MTRGLLTVEFTEPNPGALMSFTGRPNCAWFHRLKNSARKFRPMFSQGRANCLITEKSVFTKSGPYTGTREALPSVRRGGATKQVGLIYWSLLWLAA